MAIRLKTKWHDKERERSVEEIGGALAFTIWRLGMEGVLHLENENFQTDTQSQRMDIAMEFVIFLLHTVDRMAHDRLTDEERAGLIIATAKKLATFLQENRESIGQMEDHRPAFIALMNQRMDDYAACSYAEPEGPGFSMRRTFGNHVTGVMGERDRKWVTDYVMDIETPEAMKTLKRAVRSLLGWDLP